MLVYQVCTHGLLESEVVIRGFVRIPDVRTSGIPK